MPSIDSANHCLRARLVAERAKSSQSYLRMAAFHIKRVEVTRDYESGHLNRALAPLRKVKVSGFFRIASVATIAFSFAVCSQR